MEESIINLKITYDADTDSAYLYLDDIREGEISETFACDDLPDVVKGDINLDFDKDGKLKGIEIIAVSKVLPLKLGRIQP